MTVEETATRTKTTAIDWRDPDRAEVRLCGGRVASLSQEERNRWHEFIVEVPEFVEHHIAEIRVAHAARVGMGEGDAAHELRRCADALYAYSVSWLADLEAERERLEAEAEAAQTADLDQ